MKRRVLVLVMAAAMLATVMPVSAETAAVNEEETSVSIQVPAEEPVEEPEKKAVEEPEEEAETVEEPAETPEEEPEAEPETAFEATVRVKLENEGDIYYGDRVTLRAEVKANAEYTVVWEYLDAAASEDADEDVWVVADKGETYSFDVDEENAALTYRAVVNDVVASKEYKLPAIQERPVEAAPEEPAEGEGPAEEPEAELDPEREIQIRATWEGDTVGIGSEVTLIAELSSYDNAVYTVQWQTSMDGENWTDVEDATEAAYTYTVTEENWYSYWRLKVDVTGVVLDEAVEG